MRVGGAHHVAQAVGSVGGDELDPLGQVLGHEVLERTVERVDREPLGLELVEDAEVGVDPGAESVGPQQTGAEPVDRRDPGVLGGARLLAQPELQEAPPDAHPHLRGGLLGEGDREDRLHRHVVVGDGSHEALDEHRGLAGAGAGADEERPVSPLDCPLLLGGQLAHPSLLQIEG